MVEIYPKAPSPKTASEIIWEQYYHAQSHGCNPTSWRVGATALDSLAPGNDIYRIKKYLTEDINFLLGIPVVVDCTLGRNEIRLVW